MILVDTDGVIMVTPALLHRIAATEKVNWQCECDRDALARSKNLLRQEIFSDFSKQTHIYYYQTSNLGQS